MSRHASLKVSAVMLLVAGVAAYAAWHSGRRHVPVEESSGRGAAGGPPRPPATPRASERTPTTQPSLQEVSETPLGEAALMATLRDVAATDPERALKLAREGNARFPNTPDAAERAWYVVKSLDSLKRFHEGRDEARIMVERYRGSHWAADVERHTLVYPLDQPSREEMQAQERKRSNQR